MVRRIFLITNGYNSVPLVRERTIRPSDRRLSAKWVPTFADRGVSHGQRDGSLRPWSRFPRPEQLLFISSSSSIVLNEAEWTPFQTHYFSENVVAQGIEPGPLDLKPGTLTSRPQRCIIFINILMYVFITFFRAVAEIFSVWILKINFLFLLSCAVVSWQYI
jgi:hypothetical protein